jgi:hypothetical protein
MATAKTTAAKADPKKATKAAAAVAPKASTPAEPPAAAPAQPDPAASTGQPDTAAAPAVQDKPAETFVDTVAAAPAPGRAANAVHRLEWAQELAELAKRIPADQVPEGIQSFKDTDRRTMNVVLSGDRLFKQEV